MGDGASFIPFVKADFGSLTSTIHPSHTLFYNGRIHGVTFISSDSAPAIDSHTFLFPTASSSPPSPHSPILDQTQRRASRDSGQTSAWPQRHSRRPTPV